MDRLLAVVAGLIFGVGQFFILRRTLRPLTQGSAPRTGLFMLLKLPLPILLLVGCALVDTGLVPFAGGAFCAGLVAAAVVNHLLTVKGGNP